ncbi:MAG TPA: NADH-quinone oxidoreductase subunit L [Nocardioidaceae bacterium]|nr:NADH-quinone oxidoreductase subunit L [Nocardioidaceae bacterium]
MSPGWVVVAPAAGAVFALAMGARPSTGWVGAGFGLLTWLLGLLVAVPALGDAAGTRTVLTSFPTGAAPIEVAFVVDSLAALMVLLATTVALLVLLYSVGYLAGERRRASYTALVLVFTSAMSLVVLADDFFVLLVGWEVMGACSYFLIGHYWERFEARAGAVKAFLLTRLGDIGLLFGIFVLASATGSFSISAAGEAAASGTMSTSQATAAMLLVLCGVVGKSAQFPLHTWLPDAMPGPTPISALIHAATMVAAGVYLVARLDDVMAAAPVARSVLAVIAAVTMLLAALFAVAQDDLKRVLAWSTVSQLAYMFAALSVGAYAAGVFHLVSHGAFKALLFLGAGAVVHAVGGTSMEVMGGLRRRLPLTFVTTTIGFAALAGLVPAAGFFSKDAVLGGLLDAALHEGSWQGWLLLVSGLLTVVVTAAYSMRAWLLVFFGRPHGADVLHEAPWMMHAPLIVLAACSLAGGALVLAPDVLDPLGRGPADLVHPVLAIATTAAVLLTALVTYAEWWRVDGIDPVARFGPVRRGLFAELGVGRAYQAAVVRPTWALARLVVATDRDVVEPYVRGAGVTAGGLGTALRWLQRGNAQVYVAAVVVGALAIGLTAGWLGA